MSGPTLPPTIELCQRIRDGLPCLGRVHRSGVPEIACCTACGKRDAGAIYVLRNEAERDLVLSVLRLGYLERGGSLGQEEIDSYNEALTRFLNPGEQE